MNSQSQEVIRFVSVVFRHGNRAPASLEMKFLSKDVKSFDNFYPNGPGELTNEGKRNMYKLGTELRARYKNVLSDIYIPGEVEGRSTVMSRAKMSLDLVLAGLYPPMEVQTWNPELKWQPIPTISLPPNQDALLIPWTGTPEYIEEFQRISSLPEVVEKAEEFRPLAKKLSNFTGHPVASVRDLWFLYNGLMGLQSMNHQLPQWANDIFPKGALYDACCLQYDMFHYNDLLKKLSGGILLKRMIDDMKTAMEPSCSINRQKINLFSCHEVNITGVLAALGLWKPHVPEYSSAVIVELVQRGNHYYVKVIRYLGIPAEFEEQKISDCGTLCPFDKFIELLKTVTPVVGDIDRKKENRMMFESVIDKLHWAKY